MTDRKLIVPAIAGVLGIAAIASAVEPTASELRQQIEALNQKVAKIEANEASSKQQQATLSSVLSDAERRSNLLQSGGVTGGFDGKEFFLGSADGNFKLVPNFQFQFRSVTNYGDDTNTTGDESTDSGFEIRRMKLGFKGNAFSKDLKYDFKWAFGRNSGSAVLENAFITYQFAPEWGFKVGQFKDPTFREEIMSSARQLAADRSLTNELLAGGLTDFEQGVTLIYTSEALRGEFGFIDGANSDNTDYRDGDGNPAVGNRADANFGIIGRVEYKVMGDWKAYEDFTPMKTTADLLVIGGGINFTQAGSGNVYYHTVDAQYESGSTPFGAYVAYIGNYADDGDSTYSWGGIVQGSYMFDKNIEAFARYSLTDLDGGDTYNEITVGANYYFAGHNAKATVDVVFLPDGSPTNESGIGVKSGDDFQFAVRGQFQLAL